jgi:hypothetical protein
LLLLSITNRINNLTFALNLLKDLYGVSQEKIFFKSVAFASIVNKKWHQLGWAAISDFPSQ